ncbi:hypothetical protein GQ53DRAFT_887521 [Thozetella sp. PMI_491]|nr:hypothetical protein GQ53DRAFT_887521 [Thozetella sp. PMI_491]
MLPYFFLWVVLFATGSVASLASGKWQLLFLYHVYRYQVDALGVANSAMTAGCSKNGLPCDLKSFTEYVAKLSNYQRKDASGNIIIPHQNYKSPELGLVDWAAIGDCETPEQIKKFETEMDRIQFKGAMVNKLVFTDSYAGKKLSDVVDAAVKILDQAQAKLTADKKDVVNDRLRALQAALKSHIYGRIEDIATTLEKSFQAWATDEHITPKFKTVNIDGVLKINEIDEEGTIKANNLVSDGEKAQVLRDW